MNASKALFSIAVVLGSDTLRQYLINYARPFIYSTYMPYSGLALARTSYKQLESEETQKVNVDSSLNIVSNFASLNYSNTDSNVFKEHRTSIS